MNANALLIVFVQLVVSTLPHSPLVNASQCMNIQDRKNSGIQTEDIGIEIQPFSSP